MLRKRKRKSGITVRVVRSNPRAPNPRKRSACKPGIDFIVFSHGKPLFGERILRVLRSCERGRM